MYTCVCEKSFKNRSIFYVHRNHCEPLREAIRADVRRVAAELGRAPYSSEYKKRKDPTLPGMNRLVNYWWAGWNDLVQDAGLTINPSNYRSPFMPEVRTIQVYYWQREEAAAREYGVCLAT